MTNNLVQQWMHYGTYVITGNEAGPIDAKDESDARFIAAAPEMYAALKGLFEHCAMIHKRGGEWCNQKEADAAIKAGVAAIEKAEGKC